ncbi:MAG TPA: FmdB family zinc ribbon protein [Patescibacteria group bacterium]|nr:FmdB family zinc ribbon protein [Patescibacteria group bacterium]
MPLIDYICGKCGKQYDILIGITSEKESIKCPSCGAIDNQNYTPAPTGKPIIH